MVRGFYQISVYGATPVDLTDMREYLKNPPTSDNSLISELLISATQYAEKYTGRDFRVNDWRLLIDKFEGRIELDRDPVASITSVQYLVSGALTTVDAATYYLKKGTQSSEILLFADKNYPTNQDNREQAIQIDFKTEAHACLSQVVVGIKRHVALLYAHRNDCPDPSDVMGVESVNSLYNQFRIPRI